MKVKTLLSILSLYNIQYYLINEIPPTHFDKEWRIIEDQFACLTKPGTFLKNLNVGLRLTKPNPCKTCGQIICDGVFSQAAINNILEHTEGLI